MSTKKTIVLAIKTPTEFVKCLTVELKKDYRVLKKSAPYIIGDIEPDIVLLNSNAKNILKYCKPETYVIYLSEKEVFKPNDIGYEFSDLPNNNESPQTEDEKLIRKREKWFIIRHDNLYSKDKLDKIKETLETRENANVIYDNSNHAYPLYPPQGALIIKNLIDLEADEVVHMRGIEKTTEYNTAKTMASYFKLSFKNVESSTKTSKPNPKLLGIVLPGSVRSVIKKYYG